MFLSQWERDQRIRLWQSWATLYFTDRWTVSQPLPQGDKLTYLACMCVSVWVGMIMYMSVSMHPWLTQWCFLKLCAYVHEIHLLSTRQINKFLPTATATGSLAWTMDFEPGHLTWALTLIIHCSSDSKGNIEVKTFGFKKKRKKERKSGHSLTHVAVWRMCVYAFTKNMHKYTKKMQC